MNCKDCCQDCQRIGCDIELECSGYVEPSNGTKERMDKRLEMMYKLYPNAKPTNADRIRSMTNEELADWITGIHLLTKEVGSFGEVSDKWLNWLKEEVTDEDGSE